MSSIIFRLPSLPVSNRDWGHSQYLFLKLLVQNKLLSQDEADENTGFQRTGNPTAVHQAGMAPDNVPLDDVSFSSAAEDGLDYSGGGTGNNISADDSSFSSSDDGGTGPAILERNIMWPCLRVLLRVMLAQVQ